MDTKALPPMDMSVDTTGCCPAFNPEGWDNRHLHFEDKRFVRATTRSLMHVPLDMGAVFARVQSAIEAAGAQDPDGYLILSRDLSGTRAEHFFAVTRDVPGEEMTTLSGDFLTRVFEGPYRRTGDWMHEMQGAVAAARDDIEAADAGGAGRPRPGTGDVFMFYTTCPSCARILGRNYVVGVARI